MHYIDENNKAQFEKTWLNLIELNCYKYITTHGNIEYSNDDFKKMYAEYKELTI